jgi:hypothetical protein
MAGKALASRMIRESGDRPLEPSLRLLRETGSVRDGHSKNPLPPAWVGDFFYYLPTLPSSRITDVSFIIAGFRVAHAIVGGQDDDGEGIL